MIFYRDVHIIIVMHQKNAHSLIHIQIYLKCVEICVDFHLINSLILHMFVSFEEHNFLMNPLI